MECYSVDIIWMHELFTFEFKYFLFWRNKVILSTNEVILSTNEVILSTRLAWFISCTLIQMDIKLILLLQFISYNSKPHIKNHVRFKISNHIIMIVNCLNYCLNHIYYLVSLCCIMHGIFHVCPIFTLFNAWIRLWKFVFFDIFYKKTWKCFSVTIIWNRFNFDLIWQNTKLNSHI